MYSELSSCVLPQFVSEYFLVAEKVRMFQVGDVVPVYSPNASRVEQLA